MGCCWWRLLPVVIALTLPLAGRADPAPPTRPTIQFNRWTEDWSVLADPALRTEPLDSLKYLPLASDDPQAYLSLGASLRERFETNNAVGFGTSGRRAASYLLQRLELQADLHPAEGWQMFVQIQDERAFGKVDPSAVDENQLDLEQAFLAYQTSLGDGDLKLRVGRQEMAFDLQRFVAARDGPNVRQSFDALWGAWEQGPWRLISFWSHPVQAADIRPFDDYSDDRLQYGGFRVERAEVGPGALSGYYSRYQRDNARLLFASGDERRDNFDLRYAGSLDGFDWDLEAMGQTGTIGNRDIRAWAIGSLAGYRLLDQPWQPRFGLQLDAASGNRHPGGTVETFNPLFPNGYYFTLAGYTGYSNLIHVKPSLTLWPVPGLKLLAAAGLQWRMTTADAVYTQPLVPVPGTAGQGGRWSGAYGQLRADYSFNSHLTGAVEAVHFAVGDAIRRAGGHDSDYLGIELKFSW